MTQETNSNQRLNVDDASIKESQMGQAGRDLTQTVIYNYYYEKHTVTTSTEDDIDDDLICPYQGLYHFNPENAEYFFGREVFVEELFEYTETRNFIPVLGASGSGKSSVILAGLVPKLVEAGRWQFTHFRPGNDPFNALAQALVPLYEPNLNKTELIAQARQLSGYFQDNTVPLSDVFATIQQNNPQNRTLLIADQFEELYTLCPDEKIRRNFLDLLLNTFKSFAEQSSLSTVLVATMRADFLGNVLAYPPLADAVRDVDVKIRSMNENELRDIIEKPAQKLGVSFESGLVERILDDVDKQPGNLPLLEFALTELWKKRNGKQLTHNAYQEIGEVSGALTRYADDKFSKLKPEEKEQVRRIFVQLVRPGAGTEDTRRVATKAELNDSNWNLVKKLADDRLVVTSRTVITREITDHSQPKPDDIKEQETVEVVHEALIRNWGQLRQWMETDREFRTWQERLRESQRQWEEMNRDNGLLLRGAVLIQAEEQLKKRGDELPPDEREFIEFSQELQKKEEKQKQRQRQRVFGGLIAFSVIISLMAIWSESQRRQAISNQQIAEIRNLNSRLQAGQESLDVQLKVLKLAQRANPTTNIETTDVLQKIVDWPGYKEINSLEGHQGEVKGVAFSPTEDLIATASNDNTVKLWKTDGTLFRTLEGHQDVVYSVAFSQTGDFIATASWDNTVKLWKADGTLDKTFEGHQSEVNGVAFSPNGDLIASASADGTVILWKTDGTSTPYKTLKGHQGGVIGVAFSPNGDLIASASADNTVKLWKADGTLDKTFEGHQSEVNGVAFSPNGDLIASAGADSTVILWKTDNTADRTILKGHQNWVYGVAFNLKEDLIASASWDGTVKLWKVDGTLVQTFEHENKVNGVAFNPTGDLIVTASNDNTVKLWQADGTLVRTLEGHQNWVRDVAFSPTEDLIATASNDHTVKLWKTDGTEVARLEGYQDQVYGVAFSPNGDLIASAGADGTVILWKTDDTSTPYKTWKGHENEVIGVAFSQTGDFIATASWDNTVKLWKTDGTLVETLEGHEDKFYRVAFSPNGNLIASASADGTVILWKTDGTSTPYKTLKGHQGGVYDVAFSPNGDLIASASWDNTVKLWKPDGIEVATLEGHKDSVKGVAFSPNGDLIASTDVHSTVKLWKTDGTLVGTLEGHQNWVEGVAFSPNGDLIASASRDNTVKLWNINRDKLINHACGWMSDYLKNNPNINEDERHLCGVEPSATALFLQGEKLAAEGNIEEAISRFKQAVKLDSNFSSLSAVSLVRIGKSFVQGDQIEEAIAAFNQGQEFSSNIEITASDWNQLCWGGSVNKQANKVMFACNKAVELAPENGGIIDSRGLARALTGDFDGAIKDFEKFVQLAENEEKKAQRKGWIESLKKGENPFTDEVLEELP